MLTLDYKISEKSREPDASAGFELANISLTDLHYSNLFCGNLIVKSGTVDLSAGWGWIPILHAAQVINDIAKNLVDNYRDEYEFTENAEKLLFSRGDGLIHVTSTYATGEIAVNYNEFQSAARSFLDKALAEFCALRPEATNSSVISEIKQSIELFDIG